MPEMESSSAAAEEEGALPATSDKSSSSSWQAWAEKARKATASTAKAVASTARAAVAYDTVPLSDAAQEPREQSDRSASSSSSFAPLARMFGNPQDPESLAASAGLKDREKDLEAAPSDASLQDLAVRGSSWAKKAAGRMKKGLAGAADKASKSVDWTSLDAQAKGLQSQVSQGLGSLKDGAKEASGKLSETGKAAQQKAKEWQDKSQQKLAEAKEAGAAKAREAREKAASAAGKAKQIGTKAAGAAKDKLAKAGESFGGLAALTMSPAKIAQFAGVFFVGVLLISMSLTYLPLLPISPQKFSLLFTMGSTTLLASFAILKGPKAFAKSLVEKKRRPFSALYAMGWVGTLIATIVMHSYLLTAVCGGLQAFALLYFVASYVPGGQACLNLCGKMCGKCCGRLCGG